MKKVKKRDGRIVDFDSSKIINAVLAAFKDVDGEIDKELEDISTTESLAK